MKKFRTKQFDAQEQKIAKFYEVLSKQPNDAAMSQILTYLFLFICMIMAFCPAQVWRQEGDTAIGYTISWLSVFAAWAYMNKYTLVTSNRVNESIIDKLVFMPIDYKAYKKYLFHVLMRYLFRVTAVGLVIQILVTLLVYHQLSIWNFIYILGPMFVLPLIINSFSIFVHNGKHTMF